MTSRTGSPLTDSFELLGSYRTWELDSVPFRNIVIVWTARPMIDVRSRVASDRSAVEITTRDSVIFTVEAEGTIGSMPKVLWLDGMRIFP